MPVYLPQNFVSQYKFKVFRKESILKILSSWLGLKVLEEKGSLVEIEREIFNFFKPKRKQMWKAFSLSFLRAAVMYLRVFLLIIFLGKSIGGLPVLSVLGFTYLAALIPIPAALGSHEAIQIFAFNSLGLGSFAAAAFTMIIRGAELIISLVGIVILFRLGTGLLKSLLSKKISNLGIQNSKE